MEKKKCIELLIKHGVRPTSNRILMVKALACQNCPVSMKELEKFIVTIDKSNIFRTITLFRDKHLVHTIEEGRGGIKYELCLSHQDSCDDDEHLHFYCVCCHKTICLYEIPIPNIELPVGYIAENYNFVIKGVCNECTKKGRNVDNDQY